MPASLPTDPAPRLDPTVMAMVVVREFFDGAVVNLGIGIPMHCADVIPADMEVLLHSEHGLLGFGPMVRAPWSELVCFAGLGPGEVTVGGAKVVGMSQRRTRAAARFQCGVVHRWAPAELVALLALDDARRREAAAALGPVARWIGAVGSASVVEALVAALDRTGP